MGCCPFILSVFLLVALGNTNGANEVGFNQNYNLLWGNDHLFFLDQGREVVLFMDQSSGAGFASKLSYAWGFFHMRMKLAAKDSTGVITTFYLNSSNVNHDELDFEFFGNSRPPYTLQTNVFANGMGNREQKIHLWFDPTADFHSYQILWNQHQIVFYVDNIPIRVFKNNKGIGVAYPSKPMRIIGSIWTADWAGGKKIKWGDAPFEASYQGFDIGAACPYPSLQQCNSPNFWWNGKNYWGLSPVQHKAYQSVRSKYMFYDYCTDKSRYPMQPPECPTNQ